MKISESTRRDIVDLIMVERVNWSGRLEEPDFLRRVFDLERLPSTDGRFHNVYGDIRQHRILNYDWPDDWIFQDSRFDILEGNDETFLRFLCEMIHPVVRSDDEEVTHLRDIFNDCLRRDGYELVERARMSGRPIFSARRTRLSGTETLQSVRQAFSDVDAEYLFQQITRMEIAIEEDPSLAIGTAKELIETVCKTILKARGLELKPKWELMDLVKAVRKELNLTPDDIPDAAKAAETVRRILSNLASIVQGVTELRNAYGAGHGREATSKGLQARHAKLAVGAASTLTIFLV